MCVCLSGVYRCVSLSGYVSPSAEITSVDDKKDELKLGWMLQHTP